MKRILGLDIGTNSIGWALTEIDIDKESRKFKDGKIIYSGCRIIPTSQDVLGKFNAGMKVSQTAERTRYRSIRRLRERQLLRRERLFRVLNIMNFLPQHFRSQIDFKNNKGKFLNFSEPKIAYNLKNGKSEFYFKTAFEEMLKDFKKHHPALLKKSDGSTALVPFDWTIYYLRKKALSKKIEKEELSWLILNFNQKRGYYQLRSEDEEDEVNNKTENFFALKVIKVEEEKDRKSNAESWYSVYLENGFIYKRKSKTSLKDWVGKIKEFIVTTEIDSEGNELLNKDGEPKRTFKNVDSEKDWIAIKKSTEEKIEKSRKAVGEYIYDSLLHNPDQKIRGKLIRTIERKYYRSELEKILNKQKEFHPELKDKKLLSKCVKELYDKNETHRELLEQKDFTNFFVNDIIFYQRPLKSKKYLISNCKFETRFYKVNGDLVEKPVKCIPKSHPLFQEFRLWKFVKDLRIFEKEKIVNGELLFDADVTKEYLKNEDDFVKLFEWFNDKKEIDQNSFLKYPEWGLKKKSVNFRWNYVQDKCYPCNETRAQMLNYLRKIIENPSEFLTKDLEIELWHILYSISDKEELKKALLKFSQKQKLDEKFIDKFLKFPAFKRDYGSYSYKAINKMIKLMRMGKYWTKEFIDNNTLDRIEKLITGEFDESIKNRVRDKALELRCIEEFKGLPEWLASYIIYDRHSERKDSEIWKTPEEIQLLKQHSLRNPVVEQVVNETLMIVRDIWNHFGKGAKNFFDEIHIELGREMKNNSEQRKRLSQKIIENENTNLRIKALLIEIKNSGNSENVKPFSPMQQEILKLYEEGVLASYSDKLPEEFEKISKLASPTSQELKKYRLWLEQKYRSPYTGEIIPLSKLFTPAYEIEHIIPQSRYFDDSLSNKVICESEINKEKGNLTAYEFINSNPGKIIELSAGKSAKLFTLDQYKDFVSKFYKGISIKQKKLLMEDIPESFIERQLNDTRYISKSVKNLLSNIVREENEMEETSKNLISCSGMITSTLRQDWGLNDVWNEIISPRFQRLNELTNSKNFGDWEKKNGKNIFQINIPIEHQKGFSKKRIDHRHHSLDAIILACTTRDHINYLNNQSALRISKSEKNDDKLKRRYDLRNKLCHKKYSGSNKNNYKWEFNKPWDDFSKDVYNSISNIVVSFKQNLRVINKTTNNYLRLRKNENGKISREFVKQVKGDNWAIRKPLHKDTVFGSVMLKFKTKVKINAALNTPDLICDAILKNYIMDVLEKHNNDKKAVLKFLKKEKYRYNKKDISVIEVYSIDDSNVAARKKINTDFNSKKIESITDAGIQKIMLNHLKSFNEKKKGKIIEHPELAFSEDGIEEMNKKILTLNDNVPHKPIYNVRVYEPKGNKFAVGVRGNKPDKYVEAAKGTNLFFAIYVNEEGKRSYETIPLNIVIERQKKGRSPVPDKDVNGNNLLFYLSPGDLVYVPEIEEIEKLNSVSSNDLSNNLDKIYKMVSSTGSQCFFINHYVANPIVNKIEFLSLNKMEKTISGIMIKEKCFKIKINRVGMIKLYND